MPSSLEQAIADLIAESKSTRQLLRIAPVASRLAVEYGGEPRKIAERITQLGILSRINMEMSMPEAGQRDLRQEERLSEAPPDAR